MATRIRFIVLAVSLGCLIPAAALCDADTGVDGQMMKLIQSGEYQIIQEGDGQRIVMEGFRGSMGPGRPALPVKNFLIALPPGAGVQSVEVEGVGTTELPNTYRISPVPSLLPIADPALVPDLMSRMNQEWRAGYDMTYGSDTGYPEEIGWLSSAGSLRKYAYAGISFCPFRYHPQSGRLTHFGAARVTIHYTVPSPGSAEWQRTEDLKWDTLADSRAAELFTNFHEIRCLYEPSGSRPKGTTQTHDYVIITHSSLVDAVTSSDFISWKTSLGYSVRIVRTTDPEIQGQSGLLLEARMRNFLRNYYGPWGIQYVLLVGDHITVPMRYCYPDPDDHIHNPNNYGNPGGSVPTDSYYADLSLPDSESWDLDGDHFMGEYGQDLPDFLAEVAVGRIPTNNTGWITYALNKLVAFEQDDGAWKDHALHGGAILFHEHQNHDPTLPKIDGSRFLDHIETTLMGDWTISHYTELAGLEPSDYPWPGLTPAVFTGDWRTGQYAVVNWSGHGAPSGAYRLIWNWDDGDGVFETDGSDGYAWDMFSGDALNLEDDYPSIIFAVSCSVGRPEPTGAGNYGIDLIANPDCGASVGVVSATRPASITRDWPSQPGATESIGYEFERFMIAGPAGPEKVGDALYDGKCHCHVNYSLGYYRDYLEQYNFNLYGDPSLVRTGITTAVQSREPPYPGRGGLLLRNYPNPFNPGTEIRYVLHTRCHARLDIFDTLGRRVAALVDQTQSAGPQSVVWDARDIDGSELPSGIYFCRLQAGDRVETHKVVLMK